MRMMDFLSNRVTYAAFIGMITKLYVFILSNSPRFIKNLLKAAQKLRNPVHDLKTCANMLKILNRFAQLLAGSEQVVNRY